MIKYQAKVGNTYTIQGVTFKVRAIDEDQIRQIEVWKDNNNNNNNI